ITALMEESPKSFRKSVLRLIPNPIRGWLDREVRVRSNRSCEIMLGTVAINKPDGGHKLLSVLLQLSAGDRGAPSRVVPMIKLIKIGHGGRFVHHNEPRRLGHPALLLAGQIVTLVRWSLSRIGPPKPTIEPVTAAQGVEVARQERSFTPIIVKRKL